MIDQACAFAFDRKVFIESNDPCEFGMRKIQKVKKKLPFCLLITTWKSKCLFALEQKFIFKVDSKLGFFFSILQLLTVKIKIDGYIVA